MRPYADRVGRDHSPDRTALRRSRVRRAWPLVLLTVILATISLATPFVYLHAESRVIASAQTESLTDVTGYIGWILTRKSPVTRVLFAFDLHDPRTPEACFPNPHPIWTRLVLPLGHVPTNSTTNGAFVYSKYDLYGFPWPLVSVERVPGGHDVTRPLELPILLFVLWIACLAGAFVSATRALRRVRRRGRCPACGYDARGLARCPECGHAAPGNPTANRTDLPAQP